MSIKLSIEIKSILNAAGVFYTLTPSAQAVLNEVVVGEKNRRMGKFTAIWYGKQHFQDITHYSAEAVEDAWKLLVAHKAIEIIARPGQTHIFKIHPQMFDFCEQLRRLNFHIKPKKYLNEVMEGLAENPRFLLQKKNGYKPPKTQKVPPPNIGKVPPIRTSSLLGLRSRIRIPDMGSKKEPKYQTIGIVQGLSFFTDYEKHRISTDYCYLDILEAKRDMDNYKHKFNKTIYRPEGYFIDALNRQKQRRIYFERSAKWDF